MGTLAIVKKEFTDFLSSPKFWIVFAIFALLMFGSAYDGIQSYKREMELYQKQLKEQEEVKQKMQAEGIEIPEILRMKVPEPPIFFSFIRVQESIAILGALLGIILGYNAISREKKRGTLKVLLSYPTYRDSVINGKFISGVLALTLVLATVMGASIGVMIYKGLSLGAEEVYRITLFVISGLIYMILFLGIGIFFSVVLEEESSALFACIIFWMLSAVSFSTIAFIASDVIAPTPTDSQFVVAEQGQVHPAVERHEKVLWSIMKLSPTKNYEQFSGLMLSPYRPAYAESSPIPEKISIGETLSYTWQHIAILLGMLAVTFVASYVVFMKQDIK